jgi:hypothetical protein
MKVISYGGGVQSTALVVLAVRGKIAADVALFANVGDDSEHPATLRYVRDVAQLWATEHGFPIHELRREQRDGTTETLRQALARTDTRSVPIPVRMAPHGAPGNRNCTETWKIKVVRRWCRQHGATATRPTTILIGFSTDEFERVNNARTHAAERRTYPLLELGLDRAACARIIRDAGLPVPPKSSCYFCPYRTPSNFAEMRRDQPELFAQAVDVERDINRTRARIGRDPGYLTRLLRPLDTLDAAQATLFDGPESCDDGYCWI